MSNIEVSIVLPAYNEEDTIRETTETTIETLDGFLDRGQFEILIAEDGCDDKTPEIADELEEEYDCVTHFHSDERLGRGGALKNAFKESTGNTLAYIDTDLATDMRYLEELIQSVRKEGYDFATGSRWLPESSANRPASRGIPSYGYNFLVRTILGSKLQDHQCGFKSFGRDALFDIIDDVSNNHWFWDTELLVRAQKEGYSVKEFPVKWTPKPDSKVNILTDIYSMGSEIIRLKLDLR